MTSKLSGLLSFIGQAPGAVMGGLLGPSPMPPGMQGQMPQGFDDQARKQAMNTMALQMLGGQGGSNQRLAGGVSAGQNQYRSSVVDMLRMQELQRAQQEHEAEKSRQMRLSGDVQSNLPGGAMLANLPPEEQARVLREIYTATTLGGGEEVDEYDDITVDEAKKLGLPPGAYRRHKKTKKLEMVASQPQNRPEAGARRASIEGEILEKMSRGEALTEGEKSVLDHLSRMSWLDKMVEAILAPGDGVKK
jgi:hypothetical protein